MITKQHAMERLSRAYVQAVASRAGYNVRTDELDYGVDGTFKEVGVVGTRHFDSGYALDFQLKATCDWTLEDAAVVYDLEAKTYNDFIRRNGNEGSTPFVLMVLCLPQEPRDWCDFTEEQLLLKKCTYWFRPEGDPTNNTQTIRIRIPRDQLATPEAIQALLAESKPGAVA